MRRRWRLRRGLLRCGWLLPGRLCTQLASGAAAASCIQALARLTAAPTRAPPPRRCHVDAFKKGSDGWQARVAAADAARREFEELFAAEGPAPAAAGSGDGAGEEDEEGGAGAGAAEAQEQQPEPEQPRKGGKKRRAEAAASAEQAQEEEQQQPGKKKKKKVRRRRCQRGLAWPRGRGSCMPAAARCAAVRPQLTVSFTATSHHHCAQKDKAATATATEEPQEQPAKKKKKKQKSKAAA